jgi:hypothetical protein
MELSITADEAQTIAYCLSCYLDNESDKRDGVSHDILDRLQEPMLYCANGDGDLLELDLVTLPHLYLAIDLFREDAAANPPVAESLLDRIKAAFPAVIVANRSQTPSHENDHPQAGADDRADPDSDTGARPGSH